jgi:hypothetical protein
VIHAAAVSPSSGPSPGSQAKPGAFATEPLQKLLRCSGAEIFLIDKGLLMGAPPSVTLYLIHRKSEEDEIIAASSIFDPVFDDRIAFAAKIPE